MNDNKGLIESLAKLRGRFEETQRSVQRLHELRGQLDTQAKQLIVQLSDLPPEALALPQAGTEQFAPATAQKLRSLSDLRTKLELVPGVVAREQSKLQDLRQKIRAAIKALMRDCQNQADAKMTELQAKLSADMLAHCGGDEDRAKAAVDGIIANSEAKRWLEAFQYYSHDSEPVRDAQAAIELAESFERGQPLNF